MTVIYVHGWFERRQPRVAIFCFAKLAKPPVNHAEKREQLWIA